MQLYAVTDTGDWTLGLVFFAISIVLIQLLAAKPNKPIIINVNILQHLIISNAYVIAYSQVKCCLPVISKHSKMPSNPYRAAIFFKLRNTV